jgi:hypothetical protein
MAKHRFQRTRRIQVTRLLLLAGLALGWAVSPSWAEQQTPKSPLPSTKAAQTPGQKSARSTPPKSAKITAHRKGPAESSSSSPISAGKRDPFKLPDAAGGGKSGAEGILESAPGGVLPPGIRGLLISQLKLEGVVREQSANKMIAVVTNDRKLAYFLHENDSVYNGVVSKITPDSIYFKENVLDANGRVTTREVQKRLGSAPGEGR